MKLEKLFLTTVVFIQISSCTNVEKNRTKPSSNKKTKLEGNIVIEEKTDSSATLTQINATENKVSSEKGKVDFNLKKKKNSATKNDSSSINKVNIQKQDPVQIPEKWAKTYSNDPKWLALYNETSDAFLKGWTNEFLKNPNTQISKDELLYAYRRRMENIFYETPSFIEFSCSELAKSEKFREFILKFNIR